MNEVDKISVISVGFGRHLFEANNPDRIRLEICACETNHYHAVVFVRQSDDFEVINVGSNFTIHPVTGRFSISKIMAAVIKVRSLVKKIDGSVVVTTQDPFEAGLVGWLATRFTSAKLNVQEHGDVFSGSYWKSESLLNVIRFYIGLHILRFSDTVRVVARRITKTLVGYGINQQKIKQLSVMTNAEAFLNCSSKPEVISMFSADSFVFLSVARFVPQKNLPLLLKAFYAAVKECPNVRLLLVGSGSDLDTIHKLIELEEGTKDGGLVKILPWTNDVPGFMASVDSYVLSSNYEGWGRVLIEAKYAKLPVVTTDVGCVGEEIFDGKHGLVVPINDPRALTKALINMATDEEQYTKYKLEMSLEKQLNVVTYESYAKQWISTLQ